MQNIISGLFIAALLVSGMIGSEILRMAHASDVSDSRSDRERQEVVRGLLDEFGPGFVVVDGFRYRTAPRVVVKSKEGEILSSGMKELSPQMLIALVLERQIVVQIQIVSLPS